MKNKPFNGSAFLAALLTILFTLGASLWPGHALASSSSGSGGSGGGGGGSTTTADTIKVNKCYYFDTSSYVELLLNHR